MKFQNYNSENIETKNNVTYFENNKNKYKNPFINILNNETHISIELDKLASHNLFYFFRNKNFFFDTSFINLIKKVRKIDDLLLDIDTATKFIFTNTFFGSDTFLKHFYRLGPGETLIFDKKNKQLNIKRDLSLFEDKKYVYNDISDINKFKKNFSDIFIDNYRELSNSVLLNSGGFDSRLVASIFREIGFNFKSANYYDENSLDYKICKNVCDILKIEFNGYEFYELIKEIFKQEDKILQYSDYRLAYHHGHAILSNKFINLGKNFFSGIWLEFFATGFTRKDKHLPSSDRSFNDYLVNLFDNGPWSGISFKKFGNLVLNKKYKNLPLDNIMSFVESFQNKDKAKKLDIVHFFSHGVGRYMSVNNMLSKELNIITPGFNSDLFSEMLLINPNLRMHRKFEFELIKSLNYELSELEFVKDNHRLVYMGKNLKKRATNLITDFLSRKKIGIMKPQYDIYVKNFDFFDSDVTNAIYFNNLIHENSEIFYQIFDKKYKENILQNRKKISHSHFGAMKTLLEFIKLFKIKNIA